MKINYPEEISNDLIAKIQQGLRNNNLVVFPSDTVLGLFSRASKKALGRLNKFKNRTSEKNYSLIGSNIKNIERFISIDENNLGVIKKNTPGYFTFVIKPDSIKNDDILNILSSDRTLGFRIPKSKLMRMIVNELDFPIIATSANLSGLPAIYNLSELKQQVGEKINNIGLIVEFTKTTKIASSTVVDLTKNPPQILREGSGKLII